MGNSISTVGQTVDNNARLRAIQAQLYDLQTQLASGKKAQQFSGLGTQAIGSQRARAELSAIDAYQTNIDIGIARTKQMYQVVAEFRAQTENVVDAMQDQLQKGKIDIDLIKQFAGDGLSYLRDLLNSKDGDRYLLSGADAFNKPLDDSGAHGTYMQSLLQDWINGTIDTDQLISSSQSTPDTTMGYNASLSSGLARGVYVRADVNSDVDYTVFANEQGFKDILNAMALIDELDLDKIALEDGDDPLTTTTAPGATAEDQKNNFFKLYEELIKKINTGMDQVLRSEQKLNRVELQLTNIQATHKADKYTLENTVGNIEDADPTDVAVKITALQIQLSAAYQVTAQLGQLSLTQYL